jgi:hypothetical protein
MVEALVRTPREFGADKKTANFRPPGAGRTFTASDFGLMSAFLVGWSRSLPGSHCIGPDSLLAWRQFSCWGRRSERTDRSFLVLRIVARSFAHRLRLSRDETRSDRG